MKTLLHDLDQFKARGLFDKSFIMWTNHVADGPSHSFKNVPHIFAGGGGEYLAPSLPDLTLSIRRTCNSFS